jgi:predicted  nucleic acid-binding Zn-ribbon protein
MLLDTLSALIRLHDLETRPFFHTSEERERAEREIDRCREELDDSLLSAYEARKVRYGRTAVVPMSRNTCTGCNIALPSKGVKEIAEDVHVCEHCNRLIYDPDFALDFV